MHLSLFIPQWTANYRENNHEQGHQLGALGIQEEQGSFGFLFASTYPSLEARQVCNPEMPMGADQKNLEDFFSAAGLRKGQSNKKVTFLTIAILLQSNPTEIKCGLSLLSASLSGKPSMPHCPARMRYPSQQHLRHGAWLQPARVKVAGYSCPPHGTAEAKGACMSTLAIMRHHNPSQPEWCQVRQCRPGFPPSPHDNEVPVLHPVIVLEAKQELRYPHSSAWW